MAGRLQDAFGLKDRFGYKDPFSSKNCIAIGIIFPLSLMLATLTLDVARYSIVREEMQRAVDAAAVAGASDLLAEPGNCESYALVVAEMHYANGRPVSNLSDATTVSVTVSPSLQPMKGHVEVTAKMKLRPLLALPWLGTGFVMVSSQASPNPKGKIAADHPPSQAPETKRESNDESDSHPCLKKYPNFATRVV
jgi:hypothetical protein